MNSACLDVLETFALPIRTKRRGDERDEIGSEEVGSSVVIEIVFRFRFSPSCELPVLAV